MTLGNKYKDPKPVSTHKRLPPGMCGEPTEGNIAVNGIKTKTLLDTGSTVSTISKTFYEENFENIPIQKLETLLKNECADGFYLSKDLLKIKRYKAFQNPLKLYF